MMSLFSAAVLGCAAIASWNIAGAARRYSQRYLHLAALLYAALAAAGIIAGTISGDVAHLTLAVGLLVSTLAPPLLTIAVTGALTRPLFPVWAALALTLSAVAALAVAYTGLALLALIPQILALCVLLVVSLRAPRATAVRLFLSALALAAGTLAILADTQEAGAILSLFSAAGLVGVTRALARAGA